MPCRLGSFYKAHVALQMMGSSFSGFAIEKMLLSLYTYNSVTRKCIFHCIGSLTYSVAELLTWFAVLTMFLMQMCFCFFFLLRLLRERACSGDARPRTACLPQTRIGSQKQRRVQVTGGSLWGWNWNGIFLRDSKALEKICGRRIQPRGRGRGTTPVLEGRIGVTPNYT